MFNSNDLWKQASYHSNVISSTTNYNVLCCEHLFLISKCNLIPLVVIIKYVLPMVQCKLSACYVITSEWSFTFAVLVYVILINEVR